MTSIRASFPIGEAELAHWRTLFEEPDAAELAGDEIGDPPAGWTDWPAWAVTRWPSLA
ncbi:hypothetical protein [Streptomyces sp. NBRC 109706]|uniref:hypothetical protein n=1 Tax=Streptomyces sp. NBRC 109706 TaxID=1550035 RepID=UPI000B078BF4|nr:hypothetical protein [Streptomyces sp. NBRC 109706]